MSHPVVTPIRGLWFWLPRLCQGHVVDWLLEGIQDETLHSLEADFEEWLEGPLSGDLSHQGLRAF